MIPIERQETGDRGCETLAPHLCNGACKLQDGVCSEYARPELAGYETAAACMAAGHLWDARDINFENRCYPKQQAQVDKTCHDRSPQECTLNVGCALVGGRCLNATATPPCETDKKDICEAQKDKCLWSGDHCYNMPVDVRVVTNSSRGSLGLQPDGGGAAQKYYKCVPKVGADKTALCNARLPGAAVCNQTIDGGQQPCEHDAGQPESCTQIPDLCRKLSEGKGRIAAYSSGGVLNNYNAPGAWSAAVAQHQHICLNSTVNVNGGAPGGRNFPAAADPAAVAMGIIGAGVVVNFPSGGAPAQPSICAWHLGTGTCMPRLQDVCTAYYTANPPAGGAVLAARRDQCEKGQADDMLLHHQGLYGAPAVPPPLGNGANPMEYAPTLGDGAQICQYKAAEAETCKPKPEFDCDKVKLDKCGKGNTAQWCQRVPVK